MAQSNLLVFPAHDFPQPLDPRDPTQIEELIQIVNRNYIRITERPELGEGETPESYYGACEVDRGN